MKRIAKKLNAIVLALLAASALTTNACPNSLRLLLGNDTGWNIENISVWKDGVPTLISGESLTGGEGKWFDVTVTQGQLYHFYGDAEGGSIQFTLDFYPQQQNGLIDIYYYPAYYLEWGGDISATTSTISTSSSPSVGGTTSGGGTKNCGSSVTVTATPAACYTFANWTESGVVVSTSPSYSFTATASRTLVANYSLIRYSISTEKLPTGGGTISGGGLKNCGSSVTVTATPATGYTFANWKEGGTVVSTSASYTFTASANRTLVANFTPITVSISATLPNAYESTEEPGIFTITRSANSVGTALTVNLQISGTATADSDYPAINSQVTIPAGASSERMFVWPFQDNTDETDETVIVTIQNSSGYTVSGNSSGIVNVQDDAVPIEDIKLYTYSSTRENYSDGTRDLSAWGTSANIPITGIASVPTASGPFPLAIFVHHNGVGNSDSGGGASGFLYLCDLLADKGIMAVSIEGGDDLDIDNPSLGGLASAYGILALEHVKYLKTAWNIDTNRVMLIGHSSAGDGVAVANFYNNYSGPINGSPYWGPPVLLNGTYQGLGSQPLGPYHFNIKGIIALAPVGEEDAVEGIQNYLVLAGSLDSYNGRLPYERAQPINLNDPVSNSAGFKASSLFIGGNHEYFNSTYLNPTAATISRVQQEDATKVYVAAMALAVLRDQPAYLKFLKNKHFAQSIMPNGVAYFSQFQSPSRLFIDHYQEDANPVTLSPPFATVGINTWNVANSENFTEYFDPAWPFCSASFAWSNASHYYQVSFTNSTGLDTAGYGHLALRLKASGRLRIVVHDASGHHAFYGVLANPMWDGFQTVRIPLNGMSAAGVDINHIASIRLMPESAPLGSSTGTVSFDEIQLSN